MLESLHVKNFAIIDEVEVNFQNHLNILTGETGAGKSIIIGSVNAALGGKVSKDIIRTGAEYALVELVFQTDIPAVEEKLREMDLTVIEGQVLISRKIMVSGRSICKLNGETVTASEIKVIAALLLDIHGQHEHQSLLDKQKHLELLDRFAKEEIGDLKEQLAQEFIEYKKRKEELSQLEMDEEKRLREISFLEYEINEISSASLKEGEEEELFLKYKRLANAKTILESLQGVYSFTGDSEKNAADGVGRAVKLLGKIAEFDEAIQTYFEQLTELEGLLSDFNREISSYLDDFEDSSEEFSIVEERLNLINHLKKKYGKSIAEILLYLKKCEEKKAKYEDFDLYASDLKKKFDATEQKVKNISYSLSEIRKNKSNELIILIREALIDLNFLDVRFEMEFRELTNVTSNGMDEAEFMISTNPGQPIFPLGKVASGGELSRIMLAIKSVLAKKDEVGALIFDEIDVGVSGRTAQKVSEKLSVIAGSHQVLCITHLPQITAMADSHYVIEKVTDGVMTETKIRKLKENESVLELARILGGAKITDNVINNAKEMKELAAKSKKYN